MCWKLVLVLFVVYLFYAALLASFAFVWLFRMLSIGRDDGLLLSLALLCLSPVRWSKYRARVVSQRLNECSTVWVCDRRTQNCGLNCPCGFSGSAREATHGEQHFSPQLNLSCRLQGAWQNPNINWNRVDQHACSRVAGSRMECREKRFKLALPSGAS